MKSTQPRFIAWDGEGARGNDGAPQDYILLGNSLHHKITGRRLHTRECLAFIISESMANPDAIHVGFAFDYDTNEILSDLSVKEFRKLADTGHARFLEYSIEHVPNKWLQITDTRLGHTVKIQDVFGFFQCSFAKACQQYISESPTMKELNIITEGKAARATFTFEDMPYIERYWTLEITLLEELCDELRDQFVTVGIVPSGWHGPGALASTTFKAHDIERHLQQAPEPVTDAARYAYAGGRFELFRMGRHVGPVWSCDINSAYPAAIAQLPSMTEGAWVHVNHPSKPVEFGVYHIRLRGNNFIDPGPLFHRDKHYNVTFPWSTLGWYWSPEAYTVWNAKQVEILEGWEYRGWETRPFAWVKDLYNQRQELKAKGIGAQRALKLVLNSLYGKMAQRVGWERSKGPPRWHQLCWAGYVTSATRAQLYAILNRIPREYLIGVETDGIYTSADPISLGLNDSTALGMWKLEEIDEIAYAQSGVYYYRQGNEWHGKYRGLDAGSLSNRELENVLRCCQPNVEGWPVITGPTTRFIGYRSALNTARNDSTGEKFKKKHRTWETVQRDISLGNVGKRVHIPRLCDACKVGATAWEMPHQLAINSAAYLIPQSQRHDIPWISNEEAEWRDYERRQA